MEFSYYQTENFEMEKLSSDTGYFKKPVETNRGIVESRLPLRENMFINVTYLAFVYTLPRTKLARQCFILDPDRMKLH